MNHPQARREWKAVTVLGLVALALILWSVGLVVRDTGPGRGVFPPGESPDDGDAETTLELLAEVVPRQGELGCTNWRRLARLGAPLELESGELGFDALRMVFERRDGPIAWRVSVLLEVTDEWAEAVALRVECRPLDERGREVARALAARWPERVEPLAGREEPRDSWL
ncbi:MAG TPA: hypothetical protein VMT18_09135, partial [Planctomycetota bacterium]|nr:hypothetical protein [Planctomycetota bacterium]